MPEFRKPRRHRRRWSDNDRNFGPFTYAHDQKYQPVTMLLASGYDENPGCNLRLSAFGHTLIVELPAIIDPHKRKVAANWDQQTIERLGRDWYYDENPREYGFSGFEGFLNVYLGRQTHDSSTDQRRGYFLPWTQWRFIRKSYYDTEGNHFWSGMASKEKGFERYEIEREAQERCPSIAFAFADFDGERLTAKAVIEEHEWKFGTGYFKWLSLFRRPKVRRSLDIAFSGETGRRKGSWKGGTIGHSIETLPGELHGSAFRRYCKQNEMTFIGMAADLVEG